MSPPPVLVDKEVHPVHQHLRDDLDREPHAEGHFHVVHHGILHVNALAFVGMQRNDSKHNQTAQILGVGVPTYR